MSAGHIRRRGKQSWELKYDIGRDPITGRRLVKTKNVKGTKRDAERELRNILSAVDSGGYSGPTKITVAEYVRQRIDQWQAAGAVSARTAQRYRQLIENQIIPSLGAIKLQKLRRLDIETWHTALRTSGRKRGSGGVSTRTIGHAHRVLSKALSDAAKDDLITKNVCKIEPAPKVENKELRILLKDEIATLVEAMWEHPMGPIAILGLFTRMRLGEILALRWCNVEQGVIFVREALEETREHGIRVKPPKTKRGRRHITLPSIVVDTLRDHRRRQLELRMQLGLGKPSESAFAFPTADGAPQSPSAVSRAWGLAAAALGMPDVTFHSLRHTHASALIDAGVDVVTISTRLGHASPTITLQVYAHLFRKDDSKAADAINAALTGLGTA